MDNSQKLRSVSYEEVVTLRIFSKSDSGITAGNNSCSALYCLEKAYREITRTNGNLTLDSMVATADLQFSFAAKLILVAGLIEQGKCADSVPATAQAVYSKAAEILRMAAHNFKAAGDILANPTNINGLALLAFAFGGREAMAQYYHKGQVASTRVIEIYKKKLGKNPDNRIQELYDYCSSESLRHIIAMSQVMNMGWQ